MKVLFLHGWTSKAGGLKPSYLIRKEGHDVLNPALPDEDFEESVRIAEREFKEHSPDVIVGSSRGGAVAMNMESGDIPLVLLCPAWKKWGQANSVKENTIILHSVEDDVVPYQDSEELVENSHPIVPTLAQVGHSHRLSEDDSLLAMAAAIEALTS
jgi:uncharacterized protein